MTATLLPGFPVYRSAAVDENYKIVAEEVFQLDSRDDFVRFACSRAKKGQTKIIKVGALFYYFVVDSISIDRDNPPMPGGVFQIKVTTNLSMLKRGNNTIIAPWELAPFNYRSGSTKQEESISYFFPCEGDILYPGGGNTAIPFCNTAGVALEGQTSRGLTQISFSFNIRKSDFNIDNTWMWTNKTNSNQITVCGTTYGVRTLRIDSVNYEYCEDSITYMSGANEITREWEFYRCDIVMTADPNSFNRQFLNIGSHVVFGNTLQKLWTWTVSDNEGNFLIYYGTYWQYLNSGATDGQEVTENMFLSSDGTSISGFWGGIQIPTYRQGCVLIPVSFSSLQLPSGRPNLLNESNT